MNNNGLSRRGVKGGGEGRWIKEILLRVSGEPKIRARAAANDIGGHLITSARLIYSDIRTGGNSI
jgi:hypothetical protein